MESEIDPSEATARLVADLKSLAGERIKKEQLSRYVSLCQLPGVSDAQRQRGGRVLSEAIWAAIVKALEDLSGSYRMPSYSTREFDGQAIAAALRILLGLASGYETAGHERRREGAMAKLGERWSVKKWKDHGPEREIVVILADQLLSPVAGPLFAVEHEEIRLIADSVEGEYVVIFRGRAEADGSFLKQMYWTQQSQYQISLQGIGCEAEARTSGPAAWEISLFLPQLRRRQPWEFGCKIGYCDPARDQMVLAGPFSSAELAYLKDVYINLRLRGLLAGDRVWWFDGLDAVRHGDSLSWLQQRGLSPMPDGSFQKLFDGKSLEKHFGIAWERIGYKITGSGAQIDLNAFLGDMKIGPRE